MKIKTTLVHLFSYLSPKLFFSIAYIHNRMQWPNLRNPMDLSEIWIRRVLDGDINKIYYLADKYQVRNYVASRGCGDILANLIGCFDNPDMIDFNSLPNKFALKMNFGAGMNIICNNKSELDWEASKQKIQTWINMKDFSYSEKHYDLIKRKIIIEEFIDDGSGGFPVDYKFMCIKGEVVCILACSGREKGHADYLPYSTEWKPMYDYYRYFPKDLELLPKPANLEGMIRIAKSLGDGIDLVRVDLYSNGTRVWFGEMTLTPSGCIFHRWSQKALDEMGRIYRERCISIQ